MKANFAFLYMLQFSPWPQEGRNSAPRASGAACPFPKAGEILGNAPFRRKRQKGVPFPGFAPISQPKNNVYNLQLFGAEFII
jgi:hypothetical protein